MARPFANIGELKKEILKLLDASKYKDPKTELIIRYIVYLRDELRCVYCKDDYSGRSQNLSLDHIIPQSKGGGFYLDNLMTSCRRCNEKKANTLFSDKANSLIATLIWQVNKQFLKHLDFEPEHIELLEGIIASVEKRVRIFWQGELHDVIEWCDGFTLRNMHTGEFLKVDVLDKQESLSTVSQEKKQSSPYERLKKIMTTLGVTSEEINH